jgi:histone H3/H4
MSEVLIVASKVKKLIKDKSGMNTAASAVDALSKVVEREVLRAIERAQNDKRKTVMDRDFDLPAGAAAGASSEPLSAAE